MPIEEQTRGTSGPAEGRPEQATALPFSAVVEAHARIDGLVRPLAVARPWTDRVLALEHLQHTGSFKARGAANFIAAHLEQGSLPPVGVTIASGGNAGLACAWAAQAQDVRATVFVPETAPPVKVARLNGYGADVRLVGREYADALEACQSYAQQSGALQSHAYDHPLIAAGAGTLLLELLAQVPKIDTVVVAVGGGGLFAGVAAVAEHHGLRVVAVEPERCCALRAAVEAGRVTDVEVVSVAADSLGARRASEMALAAAQLGDVRSVLVQDEQIVAARRELWEEHRILVEHGAATAFAALRRDSHEANPADYGYAVEPGERTAVVLCGANTGATDL